MTTPSVDTVPADLVLEIMARLPVKSLMRLRFISKSFFSNTAAPNFITSHLALSKSSGYVALLSGSSNPRLSSIAILDKSFFEVLRPEIPFPFSPRSKSARFEDIYFLVGSCNGLLCVTYHRKNYFGRVVVLWNPMIGKFKSISDTSLDSNMLRNTTTTRITLGFGYDEKNDDYKIMRIVFSRYNTKTKSSPQAEIYSLKTNSWKRVIFPINYLNNTLYIESYICSFHNGALHWLVYERGEINPVIFSFKIDDEQFKVISLPQNYSRAATSDCSVYLMVLKESLALTIHVEVMEDEVTEMCWVWKMKKYEEVESWTKQTLPITQVSYIYGFTEDGELMFSKNDFEVSLYNPDTGALKESFMVNVDSIVLFRESLVLL